MLVAGAATLLQLIFKMRQISTWFDPLKKKHYLKCKVHIGRYIDPSRHNLKIIYCHYFPLRPLAARLAQVTLMGKLWWEGSMYLYVICQNGTCRLCLFFCKIT